MATAAKEMNRVATAMEEASVNVGTVASTTEEMSAGISKIAKNASVGMESLKKAVNQSPKTSSMIAHDINEVNIAAEEMRSSSLQVETSASELSNFTESLREITTRLKL